MRASAPPMGICFAALSPRAWVDRAYRSTLGLLKYGLAGRAIITTAIASPASNDKTSILVTHLRLRTLWWISNSARFKVDCPLLPGSHLLIACAFRAATRASVYEGTQERFGKPVEVE